MDFGGSSKRVKRKSDEVCWESEEAVKLKVSNLPDKFLERTFVSTVGRCLDRSVRSTWCIKVDKQEGNSAVITVLNQDIAKELCEKTVKWYNSKLDISPYIPTRDQINVPKQKFLDDSLKPEQTVTAAHIPADDSLDRSDNSEVGFQTKPDKPLQQGTDPYTPADDLDWDLNVNSEVEFPTQPDTPQGSCSIKISGISPPFVKEIIIPYIEEERRERGVAEDVEKIIIGCGDYNEAEGSVILEVVTNEQAIEFCNLKTIDFLKDNLTISLVAKEITSSQSTFLKISGIPRPFVEAIFLPFLEDARRDAGIERDLELTIVSYSQYNEEERSIIFEFLTYDIVDKLCELESIYYLKRHKLTISKCSSTNNVIMMEPSSATIKRIMSTSSNNSAITSSPRFPPETPSGKEMHQNKPSTSQLTPETPSSGKEILQDPSSTGLQPPVLRADWTTHTELQLLKLMLKNKHLLTHSACRLKGEGNANVYSGMEGLCLYYTHNAIKKRMKGLVEAPPKEMEEVVKEFKGIIPEGSTNIDELIKAHPDITAPRNKSKTSSRDPGKRYSDFIVVLDGHVCRDNRNLFPGDADTVLLNAYLSLKPKFDDDKTRSDQVYAEMLKIMHTSGHPHLTVDDLSSRMGALAAEFKLRYDSMVNQTGSGTDPQMWPHYDILSRIYEKSSLFEPQKIMAFGSSFANFSRSVQPYSKPSKPQKQESKPTQSKFLSGRHNENLEVKKQFLDQIKRQNDLLEQQINNQNKNK